MDAGAIALFPILVEDGENELAESYARDLFNERLGAPRRDSLLAYDLRPPLPAGTIMQYAWNP